MLRNTRPLALACAFVTPATASAEDAPLADKSAYTLLNPTPRELMREMSTDRPDSTESPYTVDAGHIQIEMSLVEFTQVNMSFIAFARNDDGPREDAYAYAPMNLKVGLLNNLDLQLLISPYERVQVRDDHDASGFGDTQLRLKWNLWGNDGGDTAFALMPFVKTPTGDDSLTNDHAEGGLIVPFATALPAGFSLGLMAELDIIRNQANEGYVLDFVHTAVLGRDLFGPVAAYVEYFGVAGTDPAVGYRAFINAGLTIGVTPDLQLDAGVRVGLTDDAEDLALFAGVSFRY